MPGLSQVPEGTACPFAAAFAAPNGSSVHRHLFRPPATSSSPFSGYLCRDPCVIAYASACQHLARTTFGVFVCVNARSTRMSDPLLVVLRNPLQVGVRENRSDGTATLPIHGNLSRYARSLRE